MSRAAMYHTLFSTSGHAHLQVVHGCKKDLWADRTAVRTALAPQGEQDLKQQHITLLLLHHAMVFTL